MDCFGIALPTVDPVLRGFAVVTSDQFLWPIFSLIFQHWIKWNRKDFLPSYLLWYAEDDFLFVNWSPPLGESIGNMSYFVCRIPSANPSLGELFHGFVCHSIDHCRGSLSHALAAAVGGSWVLSAGDGFRSWAELREGGHPVGLNWIWSPENYIIVSPYFLGNIWLYNVI